MKIEGVEITHPEKVLFPEKNITKKDVILYYDKIADFILPYLKNRPLTLRRFPEGINKKGFYQKNIPDYFPDFIPRIEIPTQDGNNVQTYCNSKKEIIYLVNQNTISFHPWLSTIHDINKPDKIVIDLDPSRNDFEEVKTAAKIIHKFLSKRDISAHLMTTGKTGIHIWYHVSPDEGFDKRREDLLNNLKILVDENPALFTLELKILKRKNRIFLDYLRNAYGQTSVCPFSLRSHKEAGVATPVDWSEINKIQSSTQYNFSNIFRRLGQKSSTQ